MEDLKKIVDDISSDIFRLYDGLDVSEEEREELVENEEPVDLYSYFSDPLDIEYRIGYDGSFRSVKVMVTCGGPNIYVDTGYGCVKGFWGTDTYERWVPSEICDEINGIFEELYNCTR